jgi:hypothetical protein
MMSATRVFIRVNSLGGIREYAHPLRTAAIRVPAPYGEGMPIKEGMNQRETMKPRPAMNRVKAIQESVASVM